MLRELGGICGNVFKLDGAVKKTTIKNCYNLGEVSSNTSGTNDANLGGIVGGLLADAEVKYCYNLDRLKRREVEITLVDLLDIVLMQL